MGGAGDIWERVEVPTGFWYGNLREIYLVLDWRIILKWIFKEYDEGD